MKQKRNLIVIVINKYIRKHSIKNRQVLFCASAQVLKAIASNLPGLFDTHPHTCGRTWTSVLKTLPDSLQNGGRLVGVHANGTQVVTYSEPGCF